MPSSGSQLKPIDLESNKSNLSANDLSQRSHRQRSKKPGHKKGKWCRGNRGRSQFQVVLEPKGQINLRKIDKKTSWHVEHGNLEEIGGKK